MHIHNHFLNFKSIIKSKTPVPTLGFNPKTIWLLGVLHLSIYLEDAADVKKFTDVSNDIFKNGLTF